MQTGGPACGAGQLSIMCYTLQIPGQVNSYHLVSSDVNCLGVVKVCELSVRWPGPHGQEMLTEMKGQNRSVNSGKVRPELYPAFPREIVFNLILKRAMTFWYFTSSW